MKYELTAIIPFTRSDESRIPALENLLNSIKAQDLRVHGTDIKNWEFIFVEQESFDGYTNVKHLTEGIADTHVILDYKGPFNKSWCMNVGAKLAKSDWLCFIDADMLFGKEYFYYANTWKSHQPVKFFVGWDTIIKLPGKDEPVTRILRNTILTAGGVFWCEKKFYWELGGMNENYFGYGGEDNDFWVRANFLVGRNKERNNISHCPYPMAHTYHHNSQPSPERFFHLDRTIQHTQEIIKRLKDTQLGNPLGPTQVTVEDLILIKESLTDKKGGGII